MRDVRTWIEIDRKALHHNVETFLRIIPKTMRFMAVIKSNAYGQGLVQVAKLLSSYKLQATSHKLVHFGVDSTVEALRLRKEEIKNPILVLGHTLPAHIAHAAEHNITLSISNFEALHALSKQKRRPSFHLKIDTGMHRQGFQLQDVSRLIKELKKTRLRPDGVFTHFASAKDVAYPTYTRMQLTEFSRALSMLEKSGIKNVIRHAAASGGTLLFPESHLDMVRIGMGLYGYWPSPEAEIRKQESGVAFKPVLTWKTIVGEVKEIPNGSFVGYDLTEKVHRKSKIAVLPIGYWHGYDRGLSSIGEVLIRGKRSRVLGRISMDMTVVDVTDIAGVRVGDEAVIIGKQGKEAIWADEPAMKIGTSPYEFLTRINPLIWRVIV